MTLKYLWYTPTYLFHNTEKEILAALFVHAASTINNQRQIDRTTLFVLFGLTANTVFETSRVLNITRNTS